MSEHCGCEPGGDGSGVENVNCRYPTALEAIRRLRNKLEYLVGSMFDSSTLTEKNKMEMREGAREDAEAILKETEQYEVK